MQNMDGELLFCILFCILVLSRLHIYANYISKPNTY
jgi:hypothetical protein